ncbi:MAG: caspase family protein, partial [Paracoccaceae bacterium]
MLRLVLILVLLSSLPTRAEIWAVVVGVGDYAHLHADLKGPPEDAALMAEVLVARGVRPAAMWALGAVRVPVGVRGGAATRAGIMAALAEVAGAARAGDTVVFSFSGHGAQAPDVNGDEGGGLDEILLPADAKGWNGAAQAVENAIVDDELLEWAEGLLSRGVKVVGLIDACHSGTSFRAVGGFGVARSLTAEQLGLPDGFEAEAAPVAQGLSGEFVFLYASQPDQRSFEYPVGDTGVWHGAFTLGVAQALQVPGQTSWARVLADAAGAMTQGAARQVPEGEGPMLDQAVFGEGAVSVRYPVEGGAVKAGLLQGLTERTEVAFYADSQGAAVLGRGVLTGIGLRKAKVAGVVPEGALWAEVEALAPPPPLRLGVPVAADDLDYAEWRSVLGRGQAGAVDLIPVLVGGEVALVGPDGVLDPVGPGSSARVVPEPGEGKADALARMLERAAHSLRLRAVFAGAAGRALVGGPGLEVGYERQAGCGGSGPLEVVDPAQGVAPCDALWLTIRNRGQRPLDVSVLYFNADFKVSPIWPDRRLVNRLAGGEHVRVGLRI